MKSILLIIVVIILSISCIPCFRYSLDGEQNNYSYVLEHNMTISKAYIKTLEWICVNYNDSKRVIQYKDMEQGKIIIRGVCPIYYLGSKYYTNYSLVINVENNIIRFSFETGTVTLNGFWHPADQTTAIINHYAYIVNSILNYCNGAK